MNNHGQKNCSSKTNGNTQEVKEISILTDSQKLKMMLGSLSWKILTMLSKKEMYPLEIAKQLGMHEQKIYYHIRKLAKAGAITVVTRRKKERCNSKILQNRLTSLRNRISTRLQTNPKPLHPKHRRTTAESSSKNSSTTAFLTEKLLSAAHSLMDHSKPAPETDITQRI